MSETTNNSTFVDPFESFENGNFAETDDQFVQGHPNNVNDEDYDWGDEVKVDDETPDTIPFEQKEEEPNSPEPNQDVEVEGEQPDEEDPSPGDEPDVTEGCQIEPESKAENAPTENVVETAVVATVEDAIQIANIAIKISRLEDDRDLTDAKIEMLQSELKELCDCQRIRGATETLESGDDEVVKETTIPDGRPWFADTPTTVLMKQFSSIKKFGDKKVANLMNAAPTLGELYDMVAGKSDMKLHDISLISKDAADQIELIFYTYLDEKNKESRNDSEV